MKANIADNVFDEFIGISDILRYKHVAGVWGLLGKNHNGWEWVTVASTNDIGDEISEDVLFMMKDISQRGTLHKYVNYWNEEIFEFRIYNEKALPNSRDYYYIRRKAMWAHVSSTYEEFSFVCLVKNEEDKEKRLSKEKYIALQTKAKYWNDINKSDVKETFSELLEIINRINERYQIKLIRK